MKKQQEMVKQFHKTFGHPCPDKPTQLTRERMELRAKWMREEITEFLDCDEDNIVEQVDAIIDGIYFHLGTLVEMGVDAEKIFEIVHEANMQKQTNKDQSKKVDKPKDWKGPEQKIYNVIFDNPTVKFCNKCRGVGQVEVLVVGTKSMRQLIKCDDCNGTGANEN